MKKALLLAMTLALAIGMSACGGKKEEEAIPITVPTPGVQQPATAPAAVTPAPGAPGAAAAAPAGPVDPVQQKLIGTAWLLGDFHVAFQDPTSVMLKGGKLKDLAPNGLKGQYSYKDGIIQVSAMGQTKTGTWDGEKLVVDGKVGVKQ